HGRGKAGQSETEPDSSFPFSGSMKLLILRVCRTSLLDAWAKRRETVGESVRPAHSPLFVAQLQRLELVLDFLVSVVGFPSLLCFETVDRFLPGRLCLLRLLQAEVDVTQMVPDRWIIQPARQGHGLLQPVAGLFQLATTEEHPAQTIQISGII